MSERSFQQLLDAAWAADKFVCVGLDSDPAKIPASAAGAGASPAEAMLCFNQKIVDCTADLVCAYKPNSAFYEAHGAAGLGVLAGTIAYIHERAPGVAVILDAKRGDVGNTNQGYVRFAFEVCGADAITVHPYLGRESLEPFLSRPGRGVLVLCRTSNPGAGEFQDVEVSGGRRLYELITEKVARDWNENGNCGVVAGSPYPREMKRIREIAGDIPMLIPGIGEQGGDLEATIEAGQDSRGRGMIINSSRAILFASGGADFAEAARLATQRLHDEINTFRQRYAGTA